MSTPSAPSPKPKWAMLPTSPAAPLARPLKGVPDPPGYSPSSVVASSSSKRAPAKSPTTPASSTDASSTDTLKLKKAWEIALAPAKQIPMNAIMMYMSGNSLQIFSIMMVFMLFKTPIQSLLAVNSTFARLESEGLRKEGKMLQVKAAFVGMQLVLLGLGVWKVNAMGLLPTTRSDWLAWETERVPLERAVFAF